MRNVTQIDVELSNEKYYAILYILRINTYFLVEPDQPDQDYNGGPNDSDLESDSQLPPQAPLQQAQQQAPPQQQAVDLSISSHFAALEMEVANKTSDSFLKNFQQKWKSQLPAQGHVVNSIRPGGHMQREMLKHKADNISSSAAETHSFAQVTNLSVQAGNRLLSVVSHVSCCRFLGDCVVG